MDGDKEKTLYEAYLRRHQYVRGGTITPHWLPDGYTFWYMLGEPYETVIYQVDVRSGERTSMFDVEKVRCGITEVTGQPPPYNGLPFEAFDIIDVDKVEFTYADIRWVINFAFGNTCGTAVFEELSSDKLFRYIEPKKDARKKSTPHLEGLVSEQESPDKQWFASVKDNNIVLRSLIDGRYHQLTSNASQNCFWNIDVPKITILSGMRIAEGGYVNPWAPDSMTLLAFRDDISGMVEQPRVHWLNPFEEVEYIRCARAGTKLKSTQPVLIDIRSHVQTPIVLPKIEDSYIHPLAWMKDGSGVLLISYDRYFKSVDIYAVNVSSAEVRSILTEKSETFVSIHHDTVMFGNHGFKMLPDESGFLWLSTRDGYQHIYHYSIDGELIAQLTKGDWPVDHICEIEANGFVYFTAGIDKKRPYDIHICRVSMTGGHTEQLTKLKGLHEPIFSPNADARMCLDVHSAVDRPTQTDLILLDGTFVCTLDKMDISALVDIGYRAAEEFVVKAADGATDLWGVLYKPVDFDETKSYPVIEYIYGGPQIISTNRGFSVAERKFLNLPWALAQLGYIVVSLDGRGTPGRSKAFQDTVYQSWDVHVIPDHAAAITQLCERNAWMDARRVGITGHSWGGYYATLALIQAPEVYSAAVASSPGAYDLWLYALHEPYLGDPKNDRRPYDRGSLIHQAADIKGHLLIVGATSDQIVSPIRMTHALIEAGIEHEFVLLPGAKHAYVNREMDYFLKKMVGWFDDHVKRF